MPQKAMAFSPIAPVVAMTRTHRASTAGFIARLVHCRQTEVFAGSALSLRIFRAAGALTGGIVSSSRLSAGEGTGGTENFSASLRTIFSGTHQSVRSESGNFLEGGRPRPPLPTRKRRSRTTALQKILKLSADPTRIARGHFGNSAPV